MLRNFFLILFRSFIRQRGYALINLLGLTAGLTAAILILIYVEHEFSYDRFHNDPENVYRVITDLNMGGREQTFALSQTPLGPEMVRSYPQFVSFTRVHKPWNSVLITAGERKFYEKNLIYADSSFIGTFNFNILQGSPKEMLNQKRSIVLTRSMANRYFSEEDPVGKTVTINNNKDFEVTGVMEDPPSNSHLDFEGILSFSTLYEGERAKWMESWIGNINYYTYFRTDGKASHAELEELLNANVFEKAGDAFQDYGFSLHTRLQRMKDIHLRSTFEHDLPTNGDIRYVMILIAVGIVILVIAAINFMNLATARSAARAREVGIRKVTGARKSNLIYRFVGESVSYAFAGFLLAILITELLLPIFSDIMGRDLDFTPVADFRVLFLFFMLSLFIGFLSGTYPAFYLSGFKPARVLKGELTRGSGGALFRNILVIVQFSISVVLIISTIIVYNQLSYIKNKKLGFDKEHVIIVPLRSQELTDKYQSLKERVENIPGVLNTTVSQNYFGNSFSGNAYKVKGMSDDESLLMNYIEVDSDFFDFYQIEFNQGRAFSEEYGSEEESIIMNEAAVKLAGLKDPLNERIIAPDSTELRIIGITRNFHFNSLRQQIEPLMMVSNPYNYNYLNVKIEPGTIPQTLERLKLAWADIDPERPFDYFFLDNTLGQLYEQEERLGQMYLYFSIVAIVIALLGLFGLSSYMTEQRFKEIGIRKVFGASVQRIVIRLTSGFLWPVVFSNILAWPVAWVLMRKWLENFAYKEGIVWWAFLLATLLSIFIASLTVSLQSYRAAQMDPARTLKDE